jgi:hypothetical protein
MPALWRGVTFKLTPPGPSTFTGCCLYSVGGSLECVESQPWFTSSKRRRNVKRESRVLQTKYKTNGLEKVEGT